MKHDQERLIQESQWMSLIPTMRFKHIQFPNKMTTFFFFFLSKERLERKKNKNKMTTLIP